MITKDKIVNLFYPILILYSAILEIRFNLTRNKNSENDDRKKSIRSKF